MSDIVDNQQITTVVFGRIDTDFLAEAINNATLSDASNLGLNSDEAEAYQNIMSSRTIDKKLNGTSISFGVNYHSVDDPGGYLDVLEHGQDAPEITGIVHLPQGGTRPTNVKFWYEGQTYEEGAKEPVIIPGNDEKLLQLYAIPEAQDAIGESKKDIAGICKSGITHYLAQAGGG